MREFDDGSFPAFDDWITANTWDGELDIIWLNGCTPSVLYPYPNQMPDGSPAEAWLDGGNMLINVGDWFAYVSYECGRRCSQNGGLGAVNILDLSPGIIVFGDNTQLRRTPAGAEYLPSLASNLTTDRPVMIGQVQFPWEVAAAFATDTGDEAGASRADPIVLHNLETDGYLAVINQKIGAGTWIDRSVAVTGFLANWVPGDAVGYTLPRTQVIVGPPEGKVGETEMDLRAVLFGQGDVTFTIRRSGDAFGTGGPLATASLDGDGRANTQILLPAYLPRGPALVDAVSTSGSTSTASLLIDSPINNAPVPTPQELVTEEDTELFFTLTATDLNEDILQFDLQDLPSHGDLNGVTPHLSYTPASGYSGGDSFTFWVNDCDDTGELATMTITVLPINDAPVATGDTTVTEEDTPVSIVLSATDADGDPLTYDIVRPPTNGTLDGTAPDLTYTPHANATGQDAFEFSVSDGVDDSGPTSVTVIVTAVDDPPTLGDLPEIAIRADGTRHVQPMPGISPGGGEDEIAQTIHVAATASDTSRLPDPVIAVNGGTYALVFAPAVGAVGDVTISVVVQDTGRGDPPHSNRTTRELAVKLLPPTPDVQSMSVGPSTPSRAGVGIDVVVEAKWITDAHFTIEGIGAAHSVAMSVDDVGDGVVQATGTYVVQQEDENVREAAVTVTATNAAGEAATVTLDGTVTVDTIASILSAQAAPREVRKGELLSLIVEAESGATVDADISALDPRAAEPVRLTEESDAVGVYRTTVAIRADSSAVAGPKLVAYQVTDAAGNTASEVATVVLVGDTTFTVDLHAGANLIHVPVRTEHIKMASDLYAKLGGHERVGLLLTEANGQLVAFAQHVQPGSAADTLLTDSSAAIAVMRHGTSVTFVGGRLESAVALRSGVNLIGVPRRGAVERAGDIAALSDSVARVIYERDGRFIPVVSRASDVPVTGGQGFLVLASDHATLQFEGVPWAGEPLTAPGHPTGDATDGTPALLVHGRCVHEVTQRDLSGVDVTLTNLRTRATVTETAGSPSGDGLFSVLFFSLTGAAARAEDVLAIQVTDSNGMFSNTRHLRHVLTDAEVRGGTVDLGLVPLSAIPARNSAPANFPNPFNPDTWIPFELAASSDVAIHIYDAGGRVVRVLRLGRRAPGVYRTQETAAHWDGRNEAGSPVSSGSYVYEIRADAYRASRRMIVLK